MRIEANQLSSLVEFRGSFYFRVAIHYLAIENILTLFKRKEWFSISSLSFVNLYRFITILSMCGADLSQLRARISSSFTLLTKTASGAQRNMEACICSPSDNWKQTSLRADRQHSSPSDFGPWNHWHSFASLYMRCALFYL